MAKKTILKTPSIEQIMLRQWCIEQAVMWPWDPGKNWPHQGQTLGGYPPAQAPAEPDVLARADRILVWVNK